MDEGHSHYQSFPETRWSLVLRANSDDPEASQRALADLCNLYWAPVYAFIRLRGYSPHNAEDLTQGFFAAFLAREDFRKVDASRGRLRSYLLGAVKHYLTDEHRRASRQKRGGNSPTFSIDGMQAESHCRIPELSDSLTPERIFDRQWATTLLENVIRQLEDRYRKEKKEALFESLSPFIMPQAELGKQAEIAARLGMSESAVRVAIHRLRQRYGILLRKTVADTLGPDGDIDEELRYLLGTFS